MKYSLLAIGLITLTAVAFAADQPKLGPEWTEDKVARNYFRMMEIRVTRSAGGNTRNYYLDLEHDKVRVNDTDGNITTSVSVNNSVSLEVRKDPKGATSAVWVGVYKCSYYDINCDGVWDAWYDGRDGTPKRNILVDDRWVRVRPIKGVFSSDHVEVNYHDQKTEYVWDGKVWKAKPAKP